MPRQAVDVDEGRTEFILEWRRFEIDFHRSKYIRDRAIKAYSRRREGAKFQVWISRRLNCRTWFILLGGRRHCGSHAKELMRTAAIAVMTLIVATSAFAYQESAWIPPWNAAALQSIQMNAGALSESNPVWY